MFGGTVLLVEDEPMIRRLLTGLLREEGFSVTSAAGGEEALLRLADSSAAPDLLLTDVSMPDMDGTELVRRALELRPSLRVVYMSGYADAAVVRERILGRGLPFLQKPFTRADLVEKVRQALAGS